jgi:hypothetical protein
LAEHRSWRRFPFYYTLLALSEIESAAAEAEIAYAADVISAKLSRKPANDIYAQRRHDVMKRALESL